MTRIWFHIISIVVVGAVLYYANLLNLENHTITIIKDGGILLVALLILELLLSIFSRIHRKRKGLSKNKKDNLISGLTNIYRLITGVSFFLFLLYVWGISPIKLFTSLSIVAAAIAIIGREYFTSIIAGFGISFSDLISIGDYVVINNQKGIVKEISLTKVHLLNDDHELVVMPNDKVFFNEIINHTKGNWRRINIKFEIDPDIIESAEQFEKEIITSLTDFTQYIKPDSFYLRIDELKKDAMLCKFYYTMEKLDQEIEQKIRKKTVRTVVDYIHRKNRFPNPESESSLA